MRLRGVLLLILIFTFNTGCSVYMAARQPDKKDLSVLNQGTERALVIAECGKPVWTGEKEGKKTDIFVFVQGYSAGAKAGRAIFHGAADVLTLGLWEVLGTPIEGVADGTKVTVEVGYDQDDRVDFAKVIKGEESFKEPESETSQTEVDP